jgi:competence ComEA-like helix-hairpin-helix protein
LATDHALLLGLAPRRRHTLPETGRVAKTPGAAPGFIAAGRDFFRNDSERAVDIEDMRPNPRHLAIAAVTSVLAIAVLIGRLTGTRGARDRPPDLRAPGPVCAGLALDDAPPLGVAFGADLRELLTAAVERLGLPSACAAVEPREPLRRGDLLRLRAADGACEIAKVERLPAPQRLICGAGVDLNRDPARDIELLPDIGPKKARAIVESREREGSFDAIDELARVKGIGEKTVERVRPWIEPPG